MFNFFKNQEEKKIESNEEDALMNETDRNIAIHTMPAKFRSDGDKADKAKVTGIIVMSVGALAIALVSAAVYFFAFKSPAKQPSNEENTQTPIETENINIAPDEENNTSEIENTLSEATSTVETEASVATSTESLSFAISDTDQDGLTSQEEILIGSDDNNLDSDGDGYSDAVELMGLYNPAGPGKLSDNQNFSKYENRTFGYGFIYPSSWTKSEIGGEDSVLFRTEGDDFFQVVVQPNAQKSSIIDWYKDQFSVQEINPEQIVAENNLEWIKSEDGLTYYTVGTDGEYIYAFSRNSQDGNTGVHKNIFEVMIKSLEMVK